jgi:mannose-6-phosphate isomerase-like protein (cupin superfamily)
VVRIIDWPAEPEDPEKLRGQMEKTFAQMYPDAHRDLKPGEHPGMHKTDTVDYAIILEGEAVAIMEEGETTMRQGDILIQRGTKHAWANRSGKPLRIAFVLIDPRC